MTRPPGTWMIYYHDYGPRLVSIQPDLETATEAVEPYHQVGWLPYGVELDAAVEAWERGEYAEKKPEPEPKINWGNPSLLTQATRDEAWEALFEMIGLKPTDHQREVVRYFLSDTVGGAHPKDVRCGDYPAPCNHDPAHPKDNQ